MVQHSDKRQQKQIMLVSHHFYPEINPRAFRATELCRELLNRGYSVDVIYVGQKRILPSDEIAQYLNEAATRPGVSRVPRNTENSLGKKLFRYFFAEKFMLTLLPWLKKTLCLTGYNAVISVGTPFYVHIAVAHALRKLKSRIPSVCDNGDPFFNYKARDKACYFGTIQCRTFGAFDYICTPIESAVNYYAGYVPREKIRVVPQGYDMENVATAKYRKCAVPTFAFAGRFYQDIRNPQTLLSFLAEIEQPFRFLVFAPNTGAVYDEVLAPFQRQLGNKLELHGMMPREQCIYELSKADFLINLENTLSMQSPSKVVDYALAARPILSFSQDAIPERKLLQWLAGNYSNPLTVDTAPFNIKNVCTQFEKMLRLDQKI